MSRLEQCEGLLVPGDQIVTFACRLSSAAEEDHPRSFSRNYRSLFETKHESVERIASSPGRIMEDKLALALKLLLLEGLWRPWRPIIRTSLSRPSFLPHGLPFVACSIIDKIQ